MVVGNCPACPDLPKPLDEGMFVKSYVKAGIDDNLGLHFLGVLITRSLLSWSLQ